MPAGPGYQVPFSQRIKDTTPMLTAAVGLITSPAQVAIAWCLANPGIASVIVGADTPEQIQEDLAAAERICRRHRAPGRVRPSQQRFEAREAPGGGRGDRGGPGLRDDGAAGHGGWISYP